MIYLVTLTFSKIPEPDKKSDFHRVLENIGFSDVIDANGGSELPLPQTMFCGKFEGETAAKVRTDLTETLCESLKPLGFKSRFMLMVAQQYAWSIRNL